MRYKDKLINAVYRIDVDEVRTLVDDRQFRDVANDIGLLDEPFPLYYITLCHSVALAEDYINDRMPRVLKLRQRCDDNKNKVVTSREIGDLIGWAAYVKMYKLLSLLRE